MVFVDIQGFTAFAEHRRPKEVVEYLNTLFSAMFESVNRKHNGIVNKFLGDGFMAVFGAPIADDGASRNAGGRARDRGSRQGDERQRPDRADGHPDRAARPAKR